MIIVVFGIIFILSTVAFITVNLIAKKLASRKRKKAVMQALSVYSNKEIPWGNTDACIDMGKLACRCGVKYWAGVDEIPETKWWAMGWLSEYNCNPLVHPMINPDMNATDKVPDGMFEPENYKIVQELKGGTE